jgi:hypothetical protein
MSSFKRINPADQFQDKIIANKRWTGTYSSYPYIDDYIKVYNGQNIPGVFDLNSPQSQSVYYKLEYDKINQLFYHDYTTGLDTQQRTAYSLNYESASATRATASYFVYNENPLFYTEFPVNPNDTIKTIYIDKDAYGNQILPGSTIISSSDFYILDDGNGNLYDWKYAFDGIDLSYFSSSYVDSNYVKEYLLAGSNSTLSIGNLNWSNWSFIWTALTQNWPSYTNTKTVAPPVFVGNVFYSFGIYIITNQYYQNYFPGYYKGGSYWNNWNTNWNGNNSLWQSSQGGGSMIVNSPSSSINVPIKISFQNEYPIYENYIYVKTKAGEFNLSYNPTLSPGTGSIVADFATGSIISGSNSSNFAPYATTLGLYDDNNQLLMVAKLGQPIPISSEDDMTFVIRYDT